MKKIILLIILLLPFGYLFAQAPQGFNYQAIVNNNDGQLMINKSVTFKFEIKLNSSTSLPIYSETHQVYTDDLGQANLIIGKGTATIGNFSTINWGNGAYFLAIELNIGNGFNSLGTTQLLSVPYALYANQSNNTQTSIYDLKTILNKNNDANNLRISNLASPTNPKDIVNLEYMNSIQSQYNLQKNKIANFDTIIKKEFPKLPAILWQKNLGGSKNDEIKGVQKTNDGGYILTGSVKSNDGDVTNNHNNDYDIWVVKIDASGNIQWQKTYGGTNSDFSACIKNTTDGGYVVLGTTFSSDGDVTNYKGNGDLWALKLDSTGTIQWQKTYGGTKVEIASTIIQNTDGSFFILGTSNSNDGEITQSLGENDFWLLKINATGIIQWQKNFGGNTNDFARNLELTTDNNLVISGDSMLNINSTTSEEINILKLSTNGVLQWQKNFGGNYSDLVSKTISTQDGGYLVGGFTFSNDRNITTNKGNSDMWIIKLTTDGTISWNKSFGGFQMDKINSMITSLDGGYYIVGETASTIGDIKGGKGLTDVILLKIKMNGDLEWSKTFGGSGADSGIEIILNNDGNLVVFGNSNSTNLDLSSNKGNSDIIIAKLSIN